MEKAKEEYSEKRKLHWDSVAREIGPAATWGRYYHKRLNEIYRSLVFPGLRVIEIGCGHGDLLAALEPAFGVGVDFSGEMVGAAALRHPDLHFIQADVHELKIEEQFDVIILSDLVNDLWDVQAAFLNLGTLANRNTRIIINFYSRVWEIPLAAAQHFELARPSLDQNWLNVEDLSDLLELADFQVIRNWAEILCPLDIPLLAPFCNRFLVKLWPFRLAALSAFMVARYVGPAPRHEKPLVSVIVPARNEAGNISEIMQRVPQMGAGTELVFVEGHSQDNTYDAIESAISENPHRTCKLFRQTGEGKGDAVRLGFEKADGEILMILDADLTVPAEDLPRFYNALVSGKGEFINGVRSVYPMEDQAMRYLNIVGNRFFSLCFSFLLGQNIKDTLCGTKVLWKNQYEIIAANRSFFGKLDPFGDFDLILGAARLNLRILDLPIRYRERVYGDTNIRRWKHGLLLLRMAVVAALRLKFA